MNQRPTPESKALCIIQNYLELGGFFNPEFMEHDKVGDMVILARDELTEAREQNAAMREAIREAYEALDCLTLVVGLTPIAGNKEALQDANNQARATLTNLQPFLK